MTTLRTLTAVLVLLIPGALMADDSETMHREPFVEALLASSRHASIPEDLDIYAPLLGRWRIEGTEWVAEGKPSKVTIDLAFVRVLDGRAIQDVWIYPLRDKQPFDSKDTAAGTTLRLYDPVERVWNVTWFDPAARKRVQLTGRKVGNEIVQVGADAHGAPRRWIFTTITPTSFVWRGERSDDGGRTWQLNAEYFGRRVAAP